MEVKPRAFDSPDSRRDGGPVQLSDGPWRQVFLGSETDIGWQRLRWGFDSLPTHGWSALERG
jgi:hypothetical protein